MSSDKKMTPQLITMPEYGKLFDLLPDPYLLITPDSPRFTLVDANEAHMSLSKRKKQDYIGKPLFEVFPDQSDTFKKTGVNAVKESILKVIKSGEPDEMDVIQYDLTLPDGSVDVHFWRPIHYPIKNSDGKIIYIIQSSRNVTEETKAQKKLEQVRTQLDIALSAGLVGTWAIDLKTNYVDADMNIAAMFGVEPEKIAGSVPLSFFIDSIHPEDRDRVLKAIDHTIKTGDEYDTEYRTIGANGDIRWVITRGSLSYDEDNNPFKFSGVIIDVTDRKAAEESVLESRAELQFMAESMPQKVFTATPDGVIDYCSPQWLSFTGLTSEQLNDGGWNDIIHPDDRKAAKKAWTEAFKNGSRYEFEARYKRADGSYRWHLTRAHPMFKKTHGISKWVGSSTDITERKQNELNLHFLGDASKILTSSLDYEDTLRKIAEIAVPDIADWCSVEMYDELSGFKQVAVAHKDPKKVKQAKEYRKAAPPDIDAPTGVARVIRTGVAEHIPVISDEVSKSVVKDDKILKLEQDLGLYSAMIVPLNIRGKIVGAISFISAEQKRIFDEDDLSIAEELAHRASLAISNAISYKSAQEELAFRERLEDELRQVNELLETRVKERTKQLEGTNIELERSNKELQDFAYVASHDLQEPLRKIQAFGNLLDEEYGDKLDEGKDYLERMRSAASRMSVLITDLLAFSRVSSKARPFVDVDLQTIAEEVVADLETRIKDTDGVVKINKLPTIKGDPVQMRQLFQNLIGNALKFHKEGVPPVVTVSSLAGKDNGGKIKHHSLVVKDNGIGFDEKYLDRIFSVFQRLHNKDSYEGTGIGLAVCRKIVERHGGTISATSKSGKGSTFRVTIPANNKGAL